jgi:DNA-binding MarR family transcriptional regulator
MTLLRTADQVKRDLASVVEPHGLTLQQFNVLRILRGAGPAGLPTLEIAERMVEQAPGITRLLDRLEKKALVGRERCPHDRRQVLVAITPGGLRLLANLDTPVAEADDSLLAGLGERRIATLIRLLDAVCQAPVRRASSLCSSKEKKA